MLHGDARLVARIVSIFDQADVPSLLWGNHLLSLYGVPIVVGDWTFVVPDALIQRGYEVLRQNGFTPHEYTDEGFRWFPFARKRLLSPCGGPVDLIVMSEIFYPGHYPDMSPDSPDLMLASDPRWPPRWPRQGCGPYPLDLHPVRLLAPPRYVETSYRLQAREFGDGHTSSYTAFWIYWVNFATKYLTLNSPHLFHPSMLRPPFRKFHLQLYPPGRWRKRRNSTPFREAIRELQAALPEWAPQSPTLHPNEEAPTVPSNEEALTVLSTDETATPFAVSDDV